MKLFFKTEFLEEPKDRDAEVTDLQNWPRITGLAWVVVTDDGAVVRGFRFKVKHDVDPPVFPPDVQKIIEEQGHPAKYVIDRFMYDVGVCDTLIAHDLKTHFGTLAAEAIRYGSRAKKRIENRLCTMDDIDEVYADDGRSLSDLYYALFEAEIDDDLEVMVALQAEIEIVQELITRGIVRTGKVDVEDLVHEIRTMR